MAKILRMVRNIMGVAGLILIYGYVSTSDFYVNELGAQPPEDLTAKLIIGAVLILPSVTYWTSKFLRMRNNGGE